MPHRGYVLIFIFWALLAIITPTLILWSATSRNNSASKEEESRRIESRKMLDSIEKRQRNNETEGERMDGAPAPAPTLLKGNENLKL
ncbi:hypothetical protein MA16_Dca017860 [Dendrobium catenatum]|uniref:Uncharacterized protein n=1 Tax=Dendrobium catenatum TaxID=906689 RepID=A0A2I0XGD7_9ASPA|nr:hypothetical protein MA16_Dca017860 [Dendrobium catenatum]